MNKQQERINIVYDGPNVEDGLIDVKSLATNLLSFANLVQRISTLTADDKTIIDIKIRAMSKGSYDVSLVMESLGAMSGIKHLFTPDNYNVVKDIVFLLLGDIRSAAVGGLSTVGLFRLYKFAKNKKLKDIKDNNNGTITITNEEHQELIIAKDLLKVYQDAEVRNAVKEVIKDTLNEEGLNKITFKTLQHEESISKEDSKYFDVQISENEEDTIIENEIIAVYSITSVTFKEDNKWTLHDGNTTIKATITDQLFLQKIENSEVAFAKYDKLKCKVLLRQNIKDKLPKNDYIVLEVLEHIQSYKQSKLF